MGSWTCIIQSYIAARVWNKRNQAHIITNLKTTKMENLFLNAISLLMLPANIYLRQSQSYFWFLLPHYLIFIKQ